MLREFSLTASLTRLPQADQHKRPAREAGRPGRQTPKHPRKPQFARQRPASLPAATGSGQPRYR